MEDLQDTIEDSRYSRAVTDPFPRPTRPLELPPEREAEEYFQELIKRDKTILSFENVMSSPLGYLLFRRHVSSVAISSCFEFLEDVQAYASSTLPEIRRARAEQITRTYLRPQRGTSLSVSSRVATSTTAGTKAGSLTARICSEHSYRAKESNAEPSEAPSQASGSHAAPFEAERLPRAPQPRRTVALTARVQPSSSGVASLSQGHLRTASHEKSTPSVASSRASSANQAASQRQQNNSSQGSFLIQPPHPSTAHANPRPLDVVQQRLTRMRMMYWPGVDGGIAVRARLVSGAPKLFRNLAGLYGRSDSSPAHVGGALSDCVVAIVRAERHLRALSQHAVVAAAEGPALPPREAAAVAAGDDGTAPPAQPAASHEESRPAGTGHKSSAVAAVGSAAHEGGGRVAEEGSDQARSVWKALLEHAGIAGVLREMAADAASQLGSRGWAGAHAVAGSQSSHQEHPEPTPGGSAAAEVRRGRGARPEASDLITHASSGDPAAAEAQEDRLDETGHASSPPSFKFSVSGTLSRSGEAAGDPEAEAGSPEAGGDVRRGRKAAELKLGDLGDCSESQDLTAAAAAISASAVPRGSFQASRASIEKQVHPAPAGTNSQSNSPSLPTSTDHSFAPEQEGDADLGGRPRRKRSTAVLEPFEARSHEPPEVLSQAARDAHHRGSFASLRLPPPPPAAGDTESGSVTGIEGQHHRIDGGRDGPELTLPQPAYAAVAAASRAAEHSNPVPLSVRASSFAFPSWVPSQLAEKLVSDALVLIRSAQSLPRHCPCHPLVISAIEGSMQTGLCHDMFDFLACISLEVVRQLHWSSFSESGDFSLLKRYLTLQRETPTRTSFQTLRILGRGGFGAVSACKKADTGRLYAMKIMSKQRVTLKRAEALVLNERAILARVRSPFVVGLRYAFQTPTELVLVQDLMVGGDLAYHISHAPSRSFDEARARFYTAQLVLGLEHLHTNSIVYRDLKPDNILMDASGNVALADLGLATVLPRSGMTSGRCGTRGYWAPEMVYKPGGVRQKYTYTVDWWSLGCVLYEMLHGVCPFRSAQARELDPSDRHRSMDLATLRLTIGCDPDKASIQAQDLISRLLIRDPSRRLGANGAQEVRQHPWFKDVDWGALQFGQVAPLFAPEPKINAASQAIIGEFDDEGLRRVSIEQSIYRSWDTTMPEAFQLEMAELLVWQEYFGTPAIEPGFSACCTVL